MTLDDSMKLVEVLVGALGDGDTFKCQRKGQTYCGTKFENKQTKEGRTVFWYGSDCTIPAQHFCPSCLAYWHAQVLRNCLFTLRRMGHKQI